MLLHRQQRLGTRLARTIGEIAAVAAATTARGSAPHRVFRSNTGPRREHSVLPRSLSLSTHLRSLPRPDRSIVFITAAARLARSGGSARRALSVSRKCADSMSQYVAASSSTPQAVQTDIKLTSLEDSLCRLLDDACRWIQETRPQPDAQESGGATVLYEEGWTCEARIAGGWVRDKLLGLDSHDLDVSLSSLTGHIFALLLRAYLMSPDFLESEVAQTPGSPFHANSSSSSQLVGHITKIAANPEQSKNLETATARVAGLELDFVNLRKEVYLGNSRIPTMTFGTALEDAQRRDITINALFYNVHSRQIEDFTRMGVADMHKRIVRTPLEPEQTFLDDPLRVLRCIRFASRLGYSVDQSITDCLHSDDRGTAIRRALESKVSRERFGIEVDKMMLGPDPKGAIDLIEELGLFHVVFAPLADDHVRGSADKSPAVAHRAVETVAALWHEYQRRMAEQRRFGSTSNGASEQNALACHVSDAFLAPLAEKESRRLLFYSAALLGLRDQEWEEKKAKWFWSGEAVVARGLKLGVKNTREPLSSLHRSATILHRPSTETFSNSHPDYRGRYLPNLQSATISPRSVRALLLRLPEITRPDCGINAPLSILWALIADYATSTTSAAASEDAGADAVAIAKPYIDLVAQLEAESAPSRVSEKPLLDGKEACEVLAIRPGRLMATILKHIEAWQFDRNAAATDEERRQLKEECKTWLRAEWERGGIILMREREAQAAGALPVKKKSKGGPAS